MASYKSKFRTLLKIFLKVSVFIEFYDSKNSSNSVGGRKGVDSIFSGLLVCIILFLVCFGIQYIFDGRAYPALVDLFRVVGAAWRFFRPYGIEPSFPRKRKIRRQRKRGYKSSVRRPVAGLRNSDN